MFLPCEFNTKDREKGWINTDFIIDAFSYLRDTDMKLAIIGSGHEKNNLEKQIAELKLDNVKIFSRIEKKQVMTALKTGKCCLAAVRNHPIYRYGLSMNKLNDYLLSGRPVVFACDAPNVVQEAGQFSLPYGDPEQYAEMIKRVRETSEEQLNKIGEKSKTIIMEKYDYRIIAGQLEKLFCM